MWLRKSTGSSKDKFSLRDFSTVLHPCISVGFGWRVEARSVLAWRWVKYVKWEILVKQKILCTLCLYICVSIQSDAKKFDGMAPPLLCAFESHFVKNITVETTYVLAYSKIDCYWSKKLNVYVYICLPVCMCTVCLKESVQYEESKGFGTQNWSEEAIVCLPKQVLSPESQGFEGVSCAFNYWNTPPEFIK